MKFSSGYIFILLLISNISFAQNDGYIDKDILKSQGFLIDAKKESLVGHYEKAISLLNNLLIKEKENPVAHYELARIHLIQKKDRDALKHAKLAAQYDPNNKWYLLLLSDIYRTSKSYKENIDIYERLCEIDGFKKQYILDESEAWMKLAKPDKALKLLNKYEKQSKKHDIQITRKIISIYRQTKNSKKEYAVINNAIARNPNNISWLNTLANFYKRQGKYADAQSVYKNILDIDPNNTHAAFEIAKDSKNEDNIDALQAIISNASYDIRKKVKLLLPHLQRLMANPNDSKLAIKLIGHATTLTQLHKDEAISWAFIADIYQQINQNKKALENYKEALNLDKSIYTVWEQALNLMNEEKDYVELQKYSDIALDYYPNKSLVYFMNGLSEFELNHFKKAESMTKESLLMSGRDRIQKSNSYHLLGLIYFQQSIDTDLYPTIKNKAFYKKSIKQFDNAIALKNKSPKLLNDLAFVVAHWPREMSEEELFMRNATPSDSTINLLVIKLKPITESAPKNSLTKGLIAFKNNNYLESIRLLEAELNGKIPFYKERLMILLLSSKALNDKIKINEYSNKLNHLN